MEPPTLDMGSFGLMIKSESQTLDLIELTKEFELDVELSKSKTSLQQDQDGITTIVSKSNVQMCKINKKLKHKRPIGFIKIQFSEQRKKSADVAEVVGRRTITRPPVGPIPMGAWCTICEQIGPYFHKEDCSDPVEDNLKITLLGFITCVIEKDYTGDNKDILELSDELKDGPDLDYKEKLNSDLEIESDNEWPLLNIKYGDVSSVGPKKNYFSNCAIVGYNFEDDSSVSIRIYNSGLIHLVSCPWKHKDFYEKVIKKVDDTEAVVDSDNYVVNPDESLVTNAFSSYSLFGDSGSEVQLNLDELYKYFWPLDEDNSPTLSKDSPKRIYTKQYSYSKTEVDHNYLQYEKDFYRYDIDYRNDLSTPKIIMRLVPCVVDSKTKIPKYCKPYKITVMIFMSGKIQSIFSYCKDRKDRKDRQDHQDDLCDESNITIDNISEQYNIIESELTKAMKFIYQSIEEVFSKVTKPLVDTNYSTTREMINTVSGTHPYKKKQKLKIGDEVDIFNTETMEWDNTGKIESINDDTYTVTFGDEEKDLKFTDLRATKQSAMQIARTKMSGTDIENKPSPYSFNSKCSGGNTFYVPFGGRQARDNLYYPYCATKNKEKYDLYIDRILNGFPKTITDEQEFKITKDSEDFDVYSGMLEPGSTDIDSVVQFTLGNEEFKGIIIDKYRTKNNKYDNKVIYKVETDDDELFEIEGKDFLPSYRQDRRWIGLGNKPKSKLLKCAKNLGLTQSRYTKEKQDEELQSEILEKLQSVLDNTFFIGKDTSVLTPSTINRMTKTPYIGLGFPENSQRALLYYTPDYQYFIDEDLLLSKLNIEIGDTDSNFLLDGYIHKTGKLLTYYPIDCIIYDDKKLRIDYINVDSDSESERTEEVKYSKNGRLFYTMYLAKLLEKNNLRKKFVKIKNPLNYAVPYLGKKTQLGVNINLESFKNRSLIKDTSDLMNKNLDLTFIPQTGNNNYLRWKRSLKTPVSLELLKKEKGRYTVGIGKKKMFEETVHVPSSIISKIKSKRKFIKFDLNFMNNGLLNPMDPLTVAIIKPIVSEEDLLSYQKTQSIINAMLSPLSEKMFKNGIEWKVSDEEILEVSDDEPAINPLIKKD